MRVQQVRIVPAVIVTFEFQKLAPSGMGAGQSQGEHGGFAARIGEAHYFGRWHHAAKSFRGLDLRGRCRREMRAVSHRIGNSLALTSDEHGRG